MRSPMFLHQSWILRAVLAGAAVAFLLYLRYESSFSIILKTVPESTMTSYQQSNVMEDDSSLGADDAIGRRFLLRKELYIRGCQKIGGRRNSGGTKNHYYYNKQHKLFICAPRKSGCSTVRNQMLALIGGLDHIPYLSLEASKFIEASFVLGREELEEALVAPSVIRVVVARHPLDRLVSGYKDKFQDGGQVTTVWKTSVTEFRTLMSLNTTDVSLTFLQYLQMIIRFKANMLDNKRWDARGHLDSHFTPSFLICHPCDVTYDYIFHTETLSEDFAYLSRHYHIPNITQELRVNSKTSSGSYEDYYRDIPGDVVREIYSIYEKDFLTYNFELPPFLRGFLEQEIHRWFRSGLAALHLH